MHPYLMRSLLYGGSFALGLSIAAVQSYWKSCSKQEKRKEIADFRAMTNINKRCKACIYNKIVCNKGNSCSFAILTWIVEFLNSATSTIDAAIYLITCTEFKEAFLAAQRRGVHIRFISDTVMLNGTGSAIPGLMSAGVEVRIAPAEERHMMHRKSVVVDKRCVISGTANWTMQSLCGNWDGFVMTNDPNIVKSFLANFEIEWDQLDPQKLEIVKGPEVLDEMRLVELDRARQAEAEEIGIDDFY